MNVDSAVATEAHRLAAAAAASAGVKVRPAEPGDLAGIIGLFERTWGVGRSPDRSMLLALDYAGNTVLLATQKGKPVGATLGFLGWAGGLHLHSHMAAMVPWHRGNGAGYALKLLQRALCIERGVTEMRWTFDPLIRRNAHFNLRKLGAEVIGFLPDFYGALGGAPVLDWSVQSRWPLDVDFEQLRAADPAAAARRRDDSRKVFAAAHKRGWRPELSAENDYVFTADAI